MKSNNSWRIRVAQILLGLGLVLALVVGRSIKAGDEPIHLTTDWSHRHVLFSGPHNFGEHIRMLSNPRFNQQTVRRNAESRFGREDWRWRRAPETPDLLKGDWSMDMGAGAGLAVGNYPAKFSFDATTAKCGTDPNPDFVVYNTGLVPTATGTVSTQTGTFTGTPAAAQTVVITNTNLPTPNSITLTSSATVNTGLNWTTSATVATDATNLAAAIVRNGAAIGVTATSAAGVVTIKAISYGAENNGATGITLTEGVTNFAFTGAATSLAGGTNGASIGAYDNLYTGCGGTVPSVFWAYNTGGQVVTSPTLSGDGKQVAFVQNVGTTASLVLLKWKASLTDTFAAPTTLTTQASAAAYTACTAPCMYTMAFTGTAPITDTNSSPFYDFANDIIWVGDDGGKLQKFTGVFKGSPLHVTTGGFPATLTAGNVATSPVFDDGSGKVFIADGTPAGMGNGQVYSVVASTGVVVKSIQLSRGVGFKDGPILDPTSENLYLFTADNTGATCGTTQNAVITMPAAFTAATTETFTNISPIGVCSPTLSIYDGTFDNAFYSGGAGHMYVCSGIGGVPTLYQLTVSAAGVLGTTATVGPPLAATGNTCGPTIEVFNTATSTDWIFTSVSGGAVTAAPISCPTAIGCIMSFNVTSGATITTATATTGHVNVAAEAPGIVVDNTVAAGTLAGASQVYFTPLSDQTCTTSTGVGGCAIQASQSGLN